MPLGSDLRPLSYIEVAVEYTSARGLDVWYDGERRVSALGLPGWAPTAAWSWGFGASTSDDTTDDHIVDNFAVRALYKV